MENNALIVEMFAGTGHFGPAANPEVGKNGADWGRSGPVGAGRGRSGPVGVGNVRNSETMMIYAIFMENIRRLWNINITYGN